MPAKAIPPGFHSVTPFLVAEDVPGLIAFLKDAFAARERLVQHDPQGGVAHAQVQVGDSLLMITSDCEQLHAAPCSLYLYVPDVDTVHDHAVRAGALDVAEPKDQFYGDRLAGVKDPAGNTWWIATHQEDVAPAELDRRLAATMLQRAAQDG
jgi:PhnB protein